MPVYYSCSSPCLVIQKILGKLVQLAGNLTEHAPWHTLLVVVTSNCATVVLVGSLACTTPTESVKLNARVHLRISAHPPFLMILWFVCMSFVYKWLLCASTHPRFLAREFQASMGTYMYLGDFGSVVSVHIHSLFQTWSQTKSLCPQKHYHSCELTRMRSAFRRFTRNVHAPGPTVEVSS